MKADLHTHTVLSCDARAKMEEYLVSAAEKKIDVFCVTEHIDNNKLDAGYGFYNPEAYFQKVEEMREICPSNVKLLAGLEYSEPHMYKADFDMLTNSYPYDFIIGSIHWANDMFPLDDKNVSAKEYFSYYWDEVLSSARCGGFDSLGHIDFPKRYYGELWYDESKLREICKHLADHEIALEINTSALRKGLSETMPGNAILSIYRDVGGRYVTVGSDAHDACDLGADNDTAKELIRSFGLQEVIFVQRKRIEIV